MGGPGRSSGASRRFSGHGFNRSGASDSIAQGLFLLILRPFYRLFMYMDSIAVLVLLLLEPFYSKSWYRAFYYLRGARRSPLLFIDFEAFYS